MVGQSCPAPTQISKYIPLENPTNEYPYVKTLQYKKFRVRSVLMCYELK